MPKPVFHTPFRWFLTSLLLSLTAQAAPEFNTVHMVTPEQIWGFSGGGIYLSRDAGQSWNMVTPQFAEPVQNMQGFALDEKRAWVTAQRGSKVVLALTQDAGQNWTELVLSDKGQGAWIKFRDPFNGMAAVFLDAGAGHQGFTLLKTSNGGISWQKVNSSKAGYFQIPEFKNGNLPDVCCFTDAVVLNDRMALVTGAYAAIEKPYFFRSTNAGKTFVAGSSALPLSATERKSFARFEIPYAKGDVVLLAGIFSTPQQASYLVTFLSQDAGKSWVRGEKLNPKAKPQLTQVLYTDAKNAFSWVGGKLYKSTTAGQTWHELKVPFENTEDLKQISFADPNSGLALLDTSLWITLNGGESWQEIKR